MMYKGKRVIENCVLCMYYREHPCECAHCEGYDNFRISPNGKELYKKIFEQGYSKRCEEACENVGDM